MCEFSDLSLKNTNLKDCEIIECEFSKCNLMGANFESSDLKNSRFQNCNLNFTSFKNAKNYSINPNENNVKKAKFSLPEIIGLLDIFDLELV